MFKFLKDKLKEAISKVTEKIEEEGTVEEIEIEKTLNEPKEETKKEEPKKEKKEQKQEEKAEEKNKEEVKEEDNIEETKEDTDSGKTEEIEEDIEEEPNVEDINSEEYIETKEDEEDKPEEKKGFFAKFADKFKKKEEVKEEDIETEKKKPKETEEDIETKEEEDKPEKEVKKEKEEPPKETKKTTPEEKVEKKKEVEEKVKLPEEKVEEPEEELVEETKEELVKPAQKEVKEEPKIVEKVPEEKVEESKEIEPKKKGFFDIIREKVVTKKISEKQFDDIFWELEVGLLENNVAVEVIEKIKEDLKEGLVEKPLPRGKIEESIMEALTKSIDELLTFEKIDLFEKIKEKKPYVICFIGINGSGKTTTIAKVTKMLKDKGYGVVLAAADTFRAAAIDQLETHGNALGVKVIKHDYGSDAAAVAFDAIKHAEAKNKDIVLIDTAGRIHSNSNLMDELEKVVRVAKPDMKIFVGEAITGNDCVEQAREFNKRVEIDAIILSKADIDEKGGASLSVSYVTKKPVIFMGTGQGYDDLEEFNKDKMMENLGF